MNAPVKTTNVYVVPTNELMHYWPIAKSHIKRVVDFANGEITVESTRQKLCDGNAQLICIMRGDRCIAAMTAEVRPCESGKRVLSVPIIGGDDMGEWFPEFHEVCKQMRDYFLCDSIQGGGRAGWVKYLKKYGWRETYRMVALDD